MRVNTASEPDRNLALHPAVKYHPTMAIGANIEAWRLVRGKSLQSIAAQLGLSEEALVEIESGEGDPPASVIEMIAHNLGIPPSWLFGHPREFALLFKEDDQGGLEQFPGGPDPVVERLFEQARPIVLSSRF